MVQTIWHISGTFAASLEDEQQYFADILLAIKQVMSAHLHDMQQKFQDRFDRLEEELRSKNDIIQQLKAHIGELEALTDDSFTVSQRLVNLGHIMNFCVGVSGHNNQQRSAVLGGTDSGGRRGVARAAWAD